MRLFKFFKILALNLSFIILVLLFTEICCLVYECKIIANECPQDYTTNKKLFILGNFIKDSYLKGLIDTEDFRQPTYKTINSNKSAILLGGGVFYIWMAIG